MNDAFKWGMLALVLPIAFPTHAAAQAQGQEMSTSWVIDPASDEVGKTITPTGHPTIFKQRLLPTQLAQTQAELTIGKVNIPAGAELFKVESSSGAIFCFTNIQDGSSLKQLLAWSLPDQQCLYDADKSGKFTSYFQVKGKVRGLPIIRGLMPKPTPLPLLIPYNLVSPFQIKRPYWIGFWYIGRVLSKNPKFAVQFGSDTGKESLTGTIGADGKSYPSELSILGSLMEIDADSANQISVTLKRAMPAQMFSVSVTEYMMFH
jgi:hypothetical protein